MNWIIISLIVAIISFADGFFMDNQPGGLTTRGYLMRALLIFGTIGLLQLVKVYPGIPPQFDEQSIISFEALFAGYWLTACFLGFYCLGRFAGQCRTGERVTAGGD